MLFGLFALLVDCVVFDSIVLFVLLVLCVLFVLRVLFGVIGL